MNQFRSTVAYRRGGFVLFCAMLMGCSSGSSNGGPGAAGHGGGGGNGPVGGNGGTTVTGLGGGAGATAGGNGGAAGATSVGGHVGSPGGAAGGSAGTPGTGGTGGLGGGAGLGGSAAGHKGGGGAGGATPTGGTHGTAGATGTAGTSGHGGAAGSCDPASLVWQYLLSCDTVTAGIVHTCVDYYATPAAAASSSISFRGSCLGTVLAAPCPTANSAGSCLTVASAGVVETSSSAAYSRQYGYTDAGNLTASAWQASCQAAHQQYEPPGTAASVGVPTLVCPAPGTGMGANGFAFAVATVVNGETLQCTNYYGTFTSAELASITSGTAGIMTTPCPALHAVCTCVNNTATLGIGMVSHADAISYSTSFLPMTGCESGAGPSCTTGYTPP